MTRREKAIVEKVPISGPCGLDKGTVSRREADQPGVFAELYLGEGLRPKHIAGFL
jgi:hypothetical protein